MKTDVLIIGGGAIGSAVAYCLKVAQPGCRVTVCKLALHVTVQQLERLGTAGVQWVGPQEPL